MTVPLTSPALMGRGEPKGSFWVVDPGKTAGFLERRAETGLWLVESFPLDELTATLLCGYGGPAPEFVVCEDFKLRGGPHAGDAGMTSAQGIGMCRMACYAMGVPLFLVPPICKRAGRMALDAAGLEARERCRNDHERDVVDLCGFVLRELRRCR